MTPEDKENSEPPKLRLNIVAHWADEEGNEQSEKFDDTKDGIHQALERAGISAEPGDDVEGDAYIDDEEDDGETELSEFQMRLITTVWGSDGDELEASSEAGISLSQQAAFKKFWSDLEEKFGS